MGQILACCIYICVTLKYLSIYHRTLEKERRDKLILLKKVLQSRSVSQLSNVDHTSDGIRTYHDWVVWWNRHNDPLSLVWQALSTSESEKWCSSCCLAYDTSTYFGFGFWDSLFQGSYMNGRESFYRNVRWKNHSTYDLRKDGEI